MPKPKRSIKRDSIFRSTASGPAPQQGVSQPEPETHQTAVWLTDEETGWIDVRLQEIKKSGWRGVTRSAFLRALIRAAMRRSLNLEGITGEAELEQRLTP
jgi:hypothetical protein